MSNPDFSQDPELVECAESMGAAYRAHAEREYGRARVIKPETLLKLANAARAFWRSKGERYEDAITEAGVLLAGGDAAGAMRRLGEVMDESAMKRQGI